MTSILDGKAIAARVREEVRHGVSEFKEQFDRVPGLHVVLAGEDGASKVYVRNKEKAAAEVGIDGKVHRLPSTVSEAEILGLVRELNQTDSVDGILVQLPLPDGVPSGAILDAIDPAKDVDDFTP